MLQLLRLRLSADFFLLGSMPCAPVALEKLDGEGGCLRSDPADSMRKCHSGTPHPGGSTIVLRRTDFVEIQLYGKGNGTLVSLRIIITYKCGVSFHCG